MAKSDFLGGLLKNPSVIAIAALGVLAFVFRDKISSFASGITGGAKTVSNFGEVGQGLSENLLGSFEGIQDIFSGKIFEGIEFPQFEFPKFELPKFELPKFELLELIDDIFKPTEQGADITTTPAAVGRASNRGRLENTSSIPSMELLTGKNIQTEIEGNFQGGGISFQGGTIRETPIEFLSLGQIVDKFNVSASRAADIRAQAKNDFGDFEFGTNTFNDKNIPELQNIGAVSDDSFQGLTAQEIALRLTGGNINNF